MDANLMAIMVRQGGVFNVEQATRCGVSQNELARRTAGGDLRLVRRAIYTTANHVEGLDLAGAHALEIAAALLARHVLLDVDDPAGPAAALVAGHTTAALLWNLPVDAPPALERKARPKIVVPTAAPPGGATEPASSTPFETGTKVPAFVPRVVELISANRCQRTYRAGVHVRPAALPPTHIAAVGGIPVTGRARTAIDLAREGRWYDAVIVADAALRAGVPAAELQAVAAYCANWRGGRQAVRAADFADPRSESPAESIARAVFADHGLPPPDLQVELGDASGRIARVDFLFRAQRTIVEVDGKVKYVAPHRSPGDVMWEEKLREDRLREAGWEVVRVTWKQLMTNPAEVAARVRAAFARAARAAS